MTHIYPTLSLLFTEPLQREERQKLFGDANASGTSTKEQDSVLGEGSARCGRSQFCGIHESRENNGA